MVIAAAVPKWHCEEYIPHSNTSLVINSSVIAAGNFSEKQCSSEGQQCTSFKFDTYMKTIVGEVGKIAFCFPISKLDTYNISNIDTWRQQHKTSLKGES